MRRNGPMDCPHRWCLRACAASASRWPRTPGGLAALPAASGVAVGGEDGRRVVTAGGGAWHGLMKGGSLRRWAIVLSLFSALRYWRNSRFTRVQCVRHTVHTQMSITCNALPALLPCPATTATAAWTCGCRTACSPAHPSMRWHVCCLCASYSPLPRSQEHRRL